MKTSIIAVGTELLFGQVVNTNAAYLSENLNHMGFDVMYHFVVGDNPGRLRAKLAEAFEDTDLVLLTGGLGPTQDDLTKEIVAEYMGAELYRDEKVVEDLKTFLRNAADIWLIITSSRLIFRSDAHLCITLPVQLRVLLFRKTVRLRSASRALRAN